jgi:hypothetical protein
MIANFPLVKAGFMAKARTIELLSKKTWQVTDDDTDVNRGATHFLIVKPGAANIGPVPNNPTMKLYYVGWNITFDLQVKYKNYKESWGQFEEIRDLVLNKFVFTLDKNLPGVKNVMNVTITAPDPPGQKPPEGTANWVGQQMVATIMQEIRVLT